MDYRLINSKNKYYGKLSYNGKLIFWATLVAFPTISSKKNIWNKAKKLSQNSMLWNIGTAEKTRLFSFICLNKYFNVQTLGIVKHHHDNYVYYCYDPINNEYHNFVVFTDLVRAFTSHNTIKNFPKVIGRNNTFYLSYLDKSNDVIYIIDPDNDNEQRVELEPLSETKKRIISDFYKLQPKPTIIDNVAYQTVDLGDGVIVGLSQEFIDNERTWFEVRQSEDNCHECLTMKHLYIRIDN